MPPKDMGKQHDAMKSFEAADSFKYLPFRSINMLVAALGVDCKLGRRFTCDSRLYQPNDCRTLNWAVVVFNFAIEFQRRTKDSIGIEVLTERRCRVQRDSTSQSGYMQSTRDEAGDRVKGAAK